MYTWGSERQDIVCGCGLSAFDWCHKNLLLFLVLHTLFIWDFFSLLFFVHWCTSYCLHCESIYVFSVLCFNSIKRVMKIHKMLANDSMSYRRCAAWGGARRSSLISLKVWCFTATMEMSDSRKVQRSLSDWAADGFVRENFHFSIHFLISCFAHLQHCDELEIRLKKLIKHVGLLLSDDHYLNEKALERVSEWVWWRWVAILWCYLLGKFKTFHVLTLPQMKYA